MLKSHSMMNTITERKGPEEAGVVFEKYIGHGVVIAIFIYRTQLIGANSHPYIIVATRVLKHPFSKPRVVCSPAFGSSLT